MASSEGHDNGNVSLEEQFQVFAKFGDSKSTGEAITLSNVDKWFKQAKIIDGKNVTTTDTGIYFKQLAKTKKAITFKEFGQFLEKLATNKKVDIAEIEKGLANCGPPGTKGTTHAVKLPAVDRLTDHAKYTGTHKKRFDEGGKGKGKEGREDLVKNTGYVQAYKDEGTFDKKVAEQEGGEDS